MVESIKQLNQITGATPASTISEEYLKTHKQDSDQIQPGTSCTLTPAATAKQQLNKKYAYLLNAASEKYNQEIEQKIRTGSIKILCPELQDINDYKITTGWQQLNHDQVYNQYIFDIIIGMRVYNIKSLQILQYISAWYLSTNNTHLINTHNHYKTQLTATLHKHGINNSPDSINQNLLRNIINHEAH